MTEHQKAALPDLASVAPALRSIDAKTLVERGAEHTGAMEVIGLSCFVVSTIAERNWDDDLLTFVGDFASTYVEPLLDQVGRPTPESLQNAINELARRLEACLEEEGSAITLESLASDGPISFSNIRNARTKRGS